ncbi:hypothetical protein [Microtetraspora malaysiensis]|uniref:hypothetical protein n=1 Tax=Microtetraspora malaysiensis TaxID=161358 RepID=UPI003D938275
MSTEQQGEQNGGQQDGATPPEQKPSFTPITSQEELNKLLSDRLARERAKFADYGDLKAKAAKLDEIEEANKTEAQKTAERLAQAEQAAATAEARALRREVALEHKLGKDDAALLDAITDEDAMRRLAERLAQQQKAAETTVGAYVPGMGKSPAAPNLDAQIAEAEAKGDTKTAVALKTRKLTQPEN